jgi:hypothetical protein
MTPARTIGAAIFAMALAGGTSAGDQAGSVVGSGSSMPPAQQAQLDPAAVSLPPPPKPQQPAKEALPDDHRILMLMLLSHTQFGPFGRFGQ